MVQQINFLQRTADNVVNNVNILLSTSYKIGPSAFDTAIINSLQPPIGAPKNYYKNSISSIRSSFVFIIRLRNLIATHTLGTNQILWPQGQSDGPSPRNSQ
jgi:hypothetical protein